MFVEERRATRENGDVLAESGRRSVHAHPTRDDLHVAFYVPSLEIGGAQRVTVTVANGLAARGYDVDLLLSYRRGDLCGAVDDGVRVVDLGTPDLPVVGVGASAPGLRSYLAREEPDVLFSAMTFATVVVLAATTRLDLDTRLVAVEHVMFEQGLTTKDWLVNELAKRWYGATDHVLAVSQGVADSVVEGTGLDSRRVTVQYNPIDVAEVRRESRAPVDHPWLTGDHEVVLTVGRLVPQKDHATLLQAFASVTERRPDARLVVVGTGHDRDDLLALAESLGVRDEVSFPGYVESAYGYMARASVFALSSRYEGLPTVLIEALACGCPIVSTACPSGPEEILRDGEFGRLVPVGDSEALGDAIVRTLRNPPDGDTLRARADDFDVPRIVDEYASFVDELAD